jgi:YHS domain-containing protein
MPDNRRNFPWGRLALAFAVVLAVVIGVAQAGGKKAEQAKPEVQEAQAQEAQSSAAAPAGIKKVENHLVCMVNNQFMGKDQIPVAVEGKTYYGCCEMCKERLAKDAASRAAVDPVSGNTVDKAKAVIAALPDGSVLYFENEKTMEQYGKK